MTTFEQRKYNFQIDFAKKVQGVHKIWFFHEKGHKKLRRVDPVREPVRFDLTGLIIDMYVYRFRQGTVEMSHNMIGPRERTCKSTPRTWVRLGVTHLYTVYNKQEKVHMHGLSMLQRQDGWCIKPDCTIRKSIQKYICSISLADLIEPVTCV